jgi:hypothetical protein
LDIFYDEKLYISKGISQAILKFNEYSSFTCECMIYDGNECERKIYFLFPYIHTHIFSVTLVTRTKIRLPYEMIASSWQWKQVKILRDFRTSIIFQSPAIYFIIFRLRIWNIQKLIFMQSAAYNFIFYNRRMHPHIKLNCIDNKEEVASNLHFYFLS